MSLPLAPEVFGPLSRFRTSTICNAIERHRTRLRNEGYMDASLMARTWFSRPMLGYALTIQMRTDAPPVSGEAHMDRTDWWTLLEQGPHPKVIVIADIGERRAVGAVAGETHAAVYKALGAVGLVTDGAIRDVDGIARLGLHTYAGTVVPSHGYAHVVSVGEPVTVAGLRVETGDLLHGDESGIVKIPSTIAHELVASAEVTERTRRQLVHACLAPGFTAASLRAAVRAHQEIDAEKI